MEKGYIYYSLRNPAGLDTFANQRPDNNCEYPFMASVQYPYLDLTVLPQIRQHAIATNGAILFDGELSSILWANGEGAQLVGAKTIREALEGDFSINPAMRRQIETAVEKLSEDDEASAVLRLKQGFKTRIVGFSVRELELPEGEKAVLLQTEGLHGRGYRDVLMAQTTVNSLDGYSHASAVLDASGGLVASSEHFVALDVAEDELQNLVQEVSSEEDRLVKRPIETKRGALAAGIARLSDNPASHLLIIADLEETGVASGSRTSNSEQPEETTAPEPDVDEPETSTTDDGQPTVGAFSNKRTMPAGGAGRWYYKQPKTESAPEPGGDGDVIDTPSDGENSITDATVSDQPISDSETSNTAQSGLVQEVSHTPIKGEEVDDQSVTATNGPDEEFKFTTATDPIRFVWRTDTENVFNSVSPELATAVGPHSADIENSSWLEVAKRHEFDNGDDILKLLNKGDTWSGKSVLWPVEGTDLHVPVDLAGLPSYDRNRNFEGFNGFGIVRVEDAMLDPDAKGMDLKPLPSRGAEGKSRGEKTETNDGDDSQPSKVVDLDARRSDTIETGERTLSSNEREVFEEIGEKLTEDGEKAPSPAQKNKTEKAIQSEITEYLPSAFAGSTRSIKETSTPAEPVKQPVGTPEHDVDTSILARLPIPVLVYRDNDLLYANNDFHKVTGYSNLQELANSGGIDALFGGTSSEETSVDARIYHANGKQLDHHAHLQRVPWDNERAMLLTLRQEGEGDDDRSEDGGSKGASSGADSTDTKTDGGEGSIPASDDTENNEPTMVSSESVLPLPIRGATPLDSDDAQAIAFGGLEADDLRSIIDTATDGIIILSDEGIVRAINRSAEALFDVESVDILDRSFTLILAPESHRSALDYLSGISGTGVASLMNDGREVIGKTTKGGLIPLFMTIGKMEKTDACCLVLRDITDWKKAEEELLTAKSQAETANAQKTEFLAKVSHEIRTPLNAIIGFSDMMIEERFGKIDNDRYRGYLRDIHRSGNHVLDLINDLLDISKIEAGKIDLDFDACDLNTLVSETVALTQPDANKERVIIRTSLSAMVPKVVADPKSLRQIVLNLVSNGIKFTKSGGQVIVSTVYEESGEVALRVRDTGVGMSEVDLARAMKPFQQVNAETDTQGTGLGLPLTRAIVEANRARFEIESTPDEGTLVEIYFPTQRVLADR